VANAVLVIDMQKGFLHEGAALYCGEAARAIIPAVTRLLDEELDRGSALFFTLDIHDPDDKEFEMWPPHCVVGTEETEFIPELLPYVAQGTVIDTRRYSAFFETDLAERLAELKPDRLIVCGVCTDICVLHSVAGARFRDYPVTVLRDCVASFDAEAHEWGLKHMEKILGAQVV